MTETHDDRVLLTETLSAWMKAAFESAFSGSGQDFSGVSVTAATSPEFGDFQCNDAMRFAKALRMAPREIAQRALDGATSHGSLEGGEAAGAGFINLRLKDEWILGSVEALVADPRLGVPEWGRGKTVVMDYGSPNITKALHIGHLRSHNIGNALDRMHRFLGYNVVADNHLGDWGTQFGITIAGYQEFGDAKALAEQPMEELERVYVRSYERSREDTGWLERCRDTTVKLQAGNEELRILWRQFVDLSLAELDMLYGRLGLSYDLVRGESHYSDKLSGVVELLTEKGLAEESEGATIVRLDDEKLPVCMVRKSDGGFNYATTDLATVASRVSEFSPDRIVYVTDERQQLHFRQVFSVCRRLGYEVALEHVWFGLMAGRGGAFSTREGNIVPLVALLDEAEERAFALVRDSRPDMPEARQKEVARAVGIGAVKYADLSQNPQSVVTFTWDKALALDGNSGPYLQYACARIASVLDKYAERFPGRDLSSFPVILSEPVERALAVKLLRFPETIVRAAHGYKPNAVCDYLYDLAQTYSTFYQNVPFLAAEEGTRESRVRLGGIVAAVLRKGLDLLGIETPERI